MHPLKKAPTRLTHQFLCAIISTLARIKVNSEMIISNGGQMRLKGVLNAINIQIEIASSRCVRVPLVL
jgi:hypothetical protein